MFVKLRRHKVFGTHSLEKCSAFGKRIREGRNQWEEKVLYPHIQNVKGHLQDERQTAFPPILKAMAGGGNFQGD